MNILIVSQYFWPESFIINELASQLKAEGHSISVFTGKPNYPEGQTYTGYSYAGIQEESYKDIPVYRIPLRPRKNGSPKNLTLNYLSFVFSGIKHAFSFSKKRKFDMIFVFAPSPITSAIPAIIIKWLTKSHLTVWVQDLWPESARDTGFLRNRWLLECVRGLVKGIYFFSDTILAQSEAFIPAIKTLVKKDKVFYYPNSVMEQPPQVNEELPSEVHELLDSNFCVVFTGNIGAAQSMGTIVDAAMHIKDIQDIKIVLVGSGSYTDWVSQKVKEKKLNNVVLLGRYPSTLMPEIFSKAAALLVTLKKNEIFTYTIPSKVQYYLAAGKPIIASIDGESGRIIEQAKAGLVSPAENSEMLAKNIKLLYHLPSSQREEMGRSSRAYFLKHYEMESQSRKLIEIFESRIKRQSK